MDYKLIALLSLTFICMSFLVEYSTAQDPTTPPDFNCTSLNVSDCGSCLNAHVKCLWCNSPKKCINYPVNHGIPQSSDCPLSQARWGVCWLNFEAMLISVSVIGGILLIAITWCFCRCCHCCCYKKDNSKYVREEQRMDRERQERSMRQDERKQERQRRNDDIRRKYGLIRDNKGYQPFDNETA